MITQKDKLKKEILSNFTNDIDNRVISWLDSVLSSIEYTTNIAYKQNALILLVTQLILYFKTSDTLLNIDNITESNKSMRSLALMQTCNDKILRIMNDLGVSPLQDAKISKLKEKQSSKDDASTLLDSWTA